MKHRLWNLWGLILGAVRVSALLQLLHHKKPLTIKCYVLSRDLYMCRRPGSFCSNPFQKYAKINNFSEIWKLCLFSDTTINLAFVTSGFNELFTSCSACISCECVCVWGCPAGYYISSILAFRATLTSILLLRPRSQIMNPLLKCALRKSSGRQILTLKFAHSRFGQRERVRRCSHLCICNSHSLAAPHRDARSQCCCWREKWKKQMARSSETLDWLQRVRHECVGLLWCLVYGLVFLGLGECYRFWDRAEQMVQHKITALKWEDAPVLLSLLIIFSVCCCTSVSLFWPRCCRGTRGGGGTERYMEAEGSRRNLQVWTQTHSLHWRVLNMQQLLSHVKMFLLIKAGKSF